VTFGPDSAPPRQLLYKIQAILVDFVEHLAALIVKVFCNYLGGLVCYKKVAIICQTATT
jgi:hypothetical protein